MGNAALGHQSLHHLGKHAGMSNIGDHLGQLMIMPLNNMVDFVLAEHQDKHNQPDEGIALFEEVQRALNDAWSQVRGVIFNTIKNSPALKRAGVSRETVAGALLVSKIVSVTDHHIESPVSWKVSTTTPHINTLNSVHSFV